MSYTTILVHLNRASRCKAVLEPALQLARQGHGQKQSHIIGLYVQTGVQAAVAVDGMGGVTMLEADLAQERQNADAVAGVFADMTRSQPFTTEFKSVEALHRDLAINVIEHAMNADLIVAGQNDPDWVRSHQLDFPERLILESGRPVLVVPYVGHYPDIGKTVVIAWKPSRESARAVFNAMPVLKRAGIVHILQISEPRAKPVEPDTELAATLARHGVKTEIHTSEAVGLSVGSELLSRVFDLGGDLLVMGAYGHARMREIMFGGATRDITRQMTVPTLFSH